MILASTVSVFFYFCNLFRTWCTLMVQLQVPFCFYLGHGPKGASVALKIASTRATDLSCCYSRNPLLDKESSEQSSRDTGHVSSLCIPGCCFASSPVFSMPGRNLCQSVNSHLRPCLHERLLLIAWNCTCDPRICASEAESFLLLI